MAKTLVVILKEQRREIRIPGIGDAREDGTSLAVWGPDGEIKARFNLGDVQRWYLQGDQT